MATGKVEDRIELTKEAGQLMGIELQAGPNQSVVVHRIAQTSSAYGRLNAGDVLVSIDGTPVTNARMASELILAAGPQVVLACRSGAGMPGLLAQIGLWLSRLLNRCSPRNVDVKTKSASLWLSRLLNRCSPRNVDVKTKSTSLTELKGAAKKKMGTFAGLFTFRLRSSVVGLLVLTLVIAVGVAVLSPYLPIRPHLLLPCPSYTTLPFLYHPVLPIPPCPSYTTLPSIPLLYLPTSVPPYLATGGHGSRIVWSL